MNRVEEFARGLWAVARVNGQHGFHQANHLIRDICHPQLLQREFIGLLFLDFLQSAADEGRPSRNQIPKCNSQRVNI